MGITAQDVVVWRDEILPKETKQALKLLASEKWLKQSLWYLAGGTALALYAGHRQSHDLDFFFPGKTFSSASLLDRLEKLGWETDVLQDYNMPDMRKRNAICEHLFSFYKSMRHDTIVGVRVCMSS